MINAIYSYIDESDPDKCKQCIDKALEFIIRLRHSYVDNDKPKPVSNYDINQEIIRQADLAGLRVGYVSLEE